ncbi:hypothetical protein [Aureibacter tunicatorum]|uniref:Uncharacterized protein n=1 Tax=Aureibacter tunicatorum TaxID=866807 RepID=A0AAE4BTS4_9BACT|nr:hypothetical protein [Aureibacter tunicatorum]MDR6240265.1 hypothetical protein [Aureibacter tunicatorum]
MKSIALQLIFLTTSIIYLKLCSPQKYVEFKKVTDDSENNYHTSSINNDSSFMNHLQIVLKAYNINFKVKNNKLYIPDSIFSNKELCKNLTTKANDSIWIYSNKIPTNSNTH